MPLNTKDEVSERSDESADGTPETVTYQAPGLEESEERPLAEVAEANAVLLKGVVEEPSQFGLARNEEAQAAFEMVEELRERVERQETVIHELVEVTELLGAAVSKSDPEAVEVAQEIISEAGSDAWPWEWGDETYRFKQERYE